MTIEKKPALSVEATQYLFTLFGNQLFREILKKGYLSTDVDLNTLGSLGMVNNDN